MKINYYLIRHGECESNKNYDIISGRNSLNPLTINGKAQSYRLFEAFSKCDLRFHYKCSSTAIRAIDTACMVFGYGNSFKQFESLEELSQGDAEGKNRKDVYTKEVLAKIRSNALDFRNPNGESLRELRKRAKRTIDYISETVYYSSSLAEEVNVGIVSHGYVIKALFGMMLDWSPYYTYFMDIDNCSVSKFTLSTTSGETRVNYINRMYNVQF